MIHYYACLGGRYRDEKGPFNEFNFPGPVMASPTGYQNYECNRNSTGAFHQVFTTSQFSIGVA